MREGILTVKKFVLRDVSIYNNSKISIFLQRWNNALLTKQYAPASCDLRVRTGNSCIHKWWCTTSNNNFPSRFWKFSKYIQSGGSNGFEVWQYDDIVFACTYRQFSFRAFSNLAWKQTFGNEVEIYQPMKKPACQVTKSLIPDTSFITVAIWTEADPITFNRMDHANTTERFSSGHCNCHASKMIFNITILLVPRSKISTCGSLEALETFGLCKEAIDSVPWTLIANRGRVISFTFANHT